MQNPLIQTLKTPQQKPISSTSMVSKNPNPADGSYLDPTGMAALPGLSPFATTTTPLTTTTTSSSTSEDPSKKIRKPYTITKSRESWTEPEHDKFLEALQLFDRDWKKIGAFIGSKSIIQIRSHAQKYFLKVQKSGTNEHLPPPRPKRKATHPYPQKASKNSIVPSQPSDAFQSSSAPLEPGYVLRPDSSSIPVDPIPSAAVASSWTNNVPTVSLSNQTKGPVAANNCCNGTESTPRTKLIGKTAEQGNHGHSMRVLPDFSQVYGFIGSVFDPNVTDQLQNLKKMDPIDVETVLLLMRNLSLNLNSPSFEEHRMMLSSHETDSETIGANNNVDQSMNVA
ncbi:SWI/SNF COMPLEX-RELATED [Salix viminalis]|uniref:SWI/SNF COMPLEX-RELATED n=1 Tax=Salix viminalis TaxID=40686 RepID=A0A9Q0TAS0_SALVM|nr:SWI/SNF COMPLEX-RELATED [Salix viminalis]